MQLKLKLGHVPCRRLPACSPKATRPSTLAGRAPRALSEGIVFTIALHGGEVDRCHIVSDAPKFEGQFHDLCPSPQVKVMQSGAHVSAYVKVSREGLHREDEVHRV